MQNTMQQDNLTRSWNKNNAQIIGYLTIQNLKEIYKFYLYMGNYVWNLQITWLTKGAVEVT